MRENHKEDKPIHSAVELLARTDYVSAAQQVFLNLLQVPQILGPRISAFIDRSRIGEQLSTGVQC